VNNRQSNFGQVPEIAIEAEAGPCTVQHCRGMCHEPPRRRLLKVPCRGEAIDPCPEADRPELHAIHLYVFWARASLFQYRSRFTLPIYTSPWLLARGDGCGGVGITLTDSALLPNIYL
jgi:hypothetical protein